MTAMLFDSGLSRRNILQILAGATAWAAAGRPGLAGEARIGKLIEDAKALPTVSQRIAFISGALRGARYRAYTLIGGPYRPEKFVVRDDGFDCVTFCETVLSAAIAHDLGEFETHLRAIRYHNGIVAWRERNHYFFEWCRNNVANKVCRWIAMDGGIEIKKTVDSQKGLSRRKFSMPVIPSAVFLANRKSLIDGDLVAFVTRQPNLDYFHVGFTAFGSHGELLLRHASETRHRVLDERMEGFIARYRVRYVSLLRPEQPAAGTDVAKKGI